MILADSSIWIDHFRNAEPDMVLLLRRGRIVMHELVLGELWMGNFRDRKAKLHSLSEMTRCNAANTVEVMALAENRRLYGRGIGWIDAHLIAACHLTDGLQLWTRDQRMASAAEDLGVLADLT